MAWDFHKPEGITWNEFAKTMFRYWDLERQVWQEYADQILVLESGAETIPLADRLASYETFRGRRLKELARKMDGKQA
jgi:hypothetical protein